MTKRIRFAWIISLLLCLTEGLFSQKAAYTVRIETSIGNMKCILYEETPMHSDNFVKLAREGFYDGTS